MSEIRVNGIGLSNGIRIGQAFLSMQKPNEVNFANKAEIDVSAEIQRFENAKKQAYLELELLKNNVKDTLEESKTDILGVQQAFLDDPAFYPEIIHKIKHENYNAIQAVTKVVEYYYNLFTDIKDDYLKERAIDIKDLGIRLNNILAGISSRINEIDHEVILVCEDLTPSELLQLDKEYLQGFVTSTGGKTSHTAILARALEIPAITGLGEYIGKIKDGDLLIIDGSEGKCIINPETKTIEQYKKQLDMEKEEIQLLSQYQYKKAQTKDGRSISVAANVGNTEEALIALNKGAEEIGLYRTELLFMNSKQMPTEDEQFIAYREMVELFAGKSVIIRTIDIGGDKEIPYLPFPKEANPFLGYRAIRYSLVHQDLFITQLRALLKASNYGDLKIMFPMISSLQEWRMAKSLFEEAQTQLREEGVPFKENIELGIMVEVPSTALLAEHFVKEVDFFSIGTNDLVQYTLAVDRMNENVAHLYDYFNPAVLQLIERVISISHKSGKWTGMCGAMAGDPLAIPILVGLGLDEWSMDASSINRIKHYLSKVDSNDCKVLTDKIMQLGTTEEVRAILNDFYKNLI